jgi:hypothetical protein
MYYPTIAVSFGKGKYRIEAEAKFIGQDIIVSVWGGDVPHIGSIVAAVPRTSHKNPAHTSATASIINFVGHKDETVARLFAENISAKLGKNSVATAGIHIDNATGKDIALLLRNCKTVCARLLKKLENMQ